MARTINIVPAAGQEDEALRRAGWQKQTTLDEARLREVAEGYLSLGFEVFVQEYRADEGCTSCFTSDGGHGRSHDIHGTVWIRPGSGRRQDDELFD